MIPSPINKKPFFPSIQETASVRFSLNAKQSESLSSMEDSGYSLSGCISKILTSIRSFFAYIFCCTTAKKEIKEEPEDDSLYPSALIEALGGEEKFNALPILTLGDDQRTDLFYDLPSPVMKGEFEDGTPFVAIKFLNRKSGETRTVTLKGEPEWKIYATDKSCLKSLGFESGQQLDSDFLTFIELVAKGKDNKFLFGKKNSDISNALKATPFDEKSQKINPWGILIHEPLEDEHPYIEKIWKAFGGEEIFNTKIQHLDVHNRASMKLKPDQLDRGVKEEVMRRGRDCSGRHFIAFTYKNKDDFLCVQTIHQKYCNNNRDWICTPASDDPTSYFYDKEGVDKNNRVNSKIIELVVEKYNKISQAILLK